MPEEEPKFIDAEQYTGGQNKELTFRMIVLEHLRKILSLSCAEFHGGYWEIRPGKFGDLSVYVPDARECYTNSVDSLHDILYPHFDKEMSKISEDTEKERIEAYDRIWGGKGRAEHKVQDYRFKKVDIKRKLFRGLNCFLERTKYMEGKVFEEEA